MGNLVFLPSLLTESFIPQTSDSVSSDAGSGGVSSGNSSGGSSLSGGNSSSGSSGGDVDNFEIVLAAGRSQVTTCLSVFGAGGIIGNIAYGLAMTFGPLAGHHFLLFMGNNAMLLCIMG